MKSYLLRKSGLALLLVCSYAQTADSQTPEGPKVRGHVYDENNETMEAVITIKEAAYRPVVSWDGYFEIDSQSDSVILHVQYLGYKAAEMKVPRDCEIEIHMEQDLNFPDDIFIGPPAIPRRLRTGYIFDSKGKPIAGASVESKGVDKDDEIVTEDDGRFEIRGSDFAELTIRVEGRKPLKFDLEALKKKQEESMHIKHDGLFIVIDFNW